MAGPMSVARTERLSCSIFSLPTELQKRIIRYVMPQVDHPFFLEPRILAPNSRYERGPHEGRNGNWNGSREGIASQDESDDHSESDDQDEKDGQSESDGEHESTGIHADYITVMNFSATCSFYRSLLAPLIFSKIVLRNTQKSGASITAIAKGKHRDVVKELHLHFIGSASEESSDTGSEASDEPARNFKEDPFLPLSVRVILSNLNGPDRLFPNLERVIIEFDFDEDEWYDHWGEDIMQQEYESVDKAVEVECSDAWRALLCETFEALANNVENECAGNGSGPYGFSAFKIAKLQPVRISALSSDKWKSLLSNHVKEFTLQLLPPVDLAGWELNSCESMAGWTGNFDEAFFNHLDLCEGLTLLPNESAPLGLYSGRHCCPLALRPDQMPRLRTLELEYIIICEELIDFVVARKDTLESLVMRDCFASLHPFVVDDGPRWANLFDALVEARPKNLTRIEVLIVKQEIDNDDLFREDYDHDACELQRMKELLEEDRGARSERKRDGTEDEDMGVANRRKREKRTLFLYATPDSKYGMCLVDKADIRKQFLKGEDQESWDALMDLVWDNGERTS
jgi:hypothetical protein